MKVVLQKYTTSDDWFYMYIDDTIIKVIHVNEMVDAPWNEEAKV